MTSPETKITGSSPVPVDVRELIAEEFARFLREEGAAHRPWDFADAILSVLDLPGRDERVRRQERDEIQKDIAEKIELRRRAASEVARDRESDVRQQVYSNGQTTAYHELAERLDRYFTERAARSHSQYTEEET